MRLEQIFSRVAVAPMFNLTRRLFLTGTTLSAVGLVAGKTPAQPRSMTIPKLGFGGHAKGGAGGRTIRVTSLDDSGPGTLRAALEDVAEPRTVRLDIPGTIYLDREIRITHPCVTIDGTGAAGHGTTVSGARLQIATHDVIVTGLQLRPGDDPSGDVPFRRDAISLSEGARDVLIVGNSLTWGLDENVSVWGTVRNVTIAYNIIGEALRDSIHIDESATWPAPHSMGLIIGSDDASAAPQAITVARNLFVSNDYRNPYIKSGKDVEIVCNVIANYGAGHQAMAIGGDDTACKAIVARNVFWPGADTRTDPRPPVDMRGLPDGSEVYFEDNMLKMAQGATLKMSGPMIAHGRLDMIADRPPFAPSDAGSVMPDQVQEDVLTLAGAMSRSGQRRAVDAGLIWGVRTRQSRIIDSVVQLPGRSGALPADPAVTSDPKAPE